MMKRRHKPSRPSDARSNQLSSKQSRKRRWGQACLVGAVILNAVALLSNLKLAQRQTEYQEKWEEEQSFIVNTKSVYGVIENRQILHSHLNTLKLLRRIGAATLDPEEHRQLILDEKSLEQQVESSLRASVIFKYLLTHDPPMEIDLDSMFARYSEEQLQALAPQYDSAAYEHMKQVKLRMNEIRDEISIIGLVHSSVLILASLAVVTGSILLLAAGQTPEIPTASVDVHRSPPPESRLGAK